jgi:hypothetical protein
MIQSFVARITQFALPIVLASATSIAAAQTISFSNSPGEAGTVTFSGVPASLQTGRQISLMDDAGVFSWNRLDFSFQTGATSDGWTFAPGGTVSMVATNGSMNGEIARGTTLFTGVLGKTTIYDERVVNKCPPECTGSDFNISASFSVSALDAGYAALLGVPAGSYTGSFLLGVDFWNGNSIALWNNPSYPGATAAHIYGRKVSLTLDQQTAPIPEPETYAMLLAGLGLLGFVARRRKQQPNA